MQMKESMMLQKENYLFFDLCRRSCNTTLDNKHSKKFGLPHLSFLLLGCRWNLLRLLILEARNSRSCMKFRMRQSSASPTLQIRLRSRKLTVTVYLRRPGNKFCDSKENKNATKKQRRVILRESHSLEHDVTSSYGFLIWMRPRFAKRATNIAGAAENPHLVLRTRCLRVLRQNNIRRHIGPRLNHSRWKNLEGNMNRNMSDIFKRVHTNTSISRKRSVTFTSTSILNKAIFFFKKKKKKI